jgi:hypothetical protein
LADWVVTEEARVRIVFSKSEEWLLGLTYFNAEHEVWRKVARQVLLDPAKGLSEDTAIAIRNIANRLIGGSC